MNDASISKTIKNQAIYSVKWTVLGELVSRFSQPVITFILAKLLAPDDYGVIGMAMILIAFSQLFLEAGMGKALIQSQKPIEKTADIVFWTNIILGVSIYVILFLAAPWLMHKFDHPKPIMVPVIRILGIQIIFSSIASVQFAILTREMAFQKLFWTKLAISLIPALFSIPMAIYGFGVWALVASSLVSAFLNLFFLWIQCPWRPHWTYDLKVAEELFSFSVWVLGEGLVVWFFAWGDNLLVGYLIGIEALGIYSFGWNISTTIITAILNPIFTIVFPFFSRLQNDTIEIRKTLHRFNKIITLIAIPVGIGLCMISPQLELVLGDRWKGVGMVIGMISIMHGFTWLVGINSEIYRAMGRPDLIFKLSLLFIAYYIPTYFLFARFGLYAFTGARMVLGLISIPIHIFLGVKILKLSPWYLWQDGKTIFISTAVMAGAIYLCGRTLTYHNIIFQLSALILVGIITYGGTMWLIDKSFLIETLALIKKAAGGKKNA
jgi:PST family polysaccharide transporter